MVISNTELWFYQQYLQTGREYMLYLLQFSVLLATAAAWLFYFSKEKHKIKTSNWFLCGSFCFSIANLIIGCCFYRDVLFMIRDLTSRPDIAFFSYYMFWSFWLNLFSFGSLLVYIFFKNGKIVKEKI